MEDLYGKTINKGLTPLDLGKSSSTRPSNFNSLSGRITPVETNNKSARQQSAFSGKDFYLQQDKYKTSLYRSLDAHRYESEQREERQQTGCGTRGARVLLGQWVAQRVQHITAPPAHLHLVSMGIHQLLTIQGCQQL